MIKYKSLPLYETCTLNYEIRRNKNPIKINEYRDACHINRSVMHAGNLWDSIKRGFNKVKNVFKKGMDFIDNNEVTKSLKDSALNYLGQKTGVDMNKIYDTAHKVIDVIPDVQETNPDSYNSTYPHNYNYNAYNSYSYPYNTTGYNNYASTNGYNNAYNYNTTGYNNAYNYNSTPTTSSYSSTYSPASNQNNSSLQNQFTNTYNQIIKQPLTAPQKAIVQSNFNKFSMGLKSCGSVDITKLVKNKTFMRNIPKMLMMASGSRSIPKDFLPILQKFGIKSLPMPKSLIPLIDKLHGPLDPMEHNKSVAKTSIAISSKPGNGRLYLGRGESDSHSSKENTSNEKKSDNLRSEGNKSAGKSSKYQDILNKLKSSKK